MDQSFADAGLFSAPATFNGSYTLVTSTGDLDRLGTLNSYFPVEKNAPFTITDIVLGVRSRFGAIACVTYQLNGEIHCHFSTGLDYHTVGEFERIIESFSEWVKLIQ